MIESEKRFLKKEKKEESKSITDVTRSIFNNFLERSDEPGEFLSENEKQKLIKESKENPEALRRLEENKSSKYRVNSLFAPLGIAEMFLESEEAKNIPLEEKKELLQKIQKVEVDIIKTKRDKITNKEVNEVVEVVKEIEKYL